MSEDRDQAGAPVEQDKATDTQVLAAVERAAEVAPAVGDERVDGDAGADAGSADAAGPDETVRPTIAATSDPPSAHKVETAEEIFAAHPTHATSGQLEAGKGGASAVQQAPTAAEAPVEPVAVPPVVPAALPPARDGEIRISADHPMAALYMQTPMAPEVKGNRGAGVLIGLLATVGFALVYAGVLALWLAPSFPPSRFLDDALLPAVLSLPFAAAVVGFLLGFTILVLIAGRAGWWAYVLGGLLVAALTWAVTLLGFALDERFAGENVNMQPMALLAEYGLFLPVIAAALVAREVAVWFGAWVGARGRKVKRQNAEAVAEYETALAEVQAKNQ